MLLHTYLFQSAFVSAHALNKRNRERVQLICLVSLVDNGQRHPTTSDTFSILLYLRHGDEARALTDDAAYIEVTYRSMIDT